MPHSKTKITMAMKDSDIPKPCSNRDMENFENGSSGGSGESSVIRNTEGEEGLGEEEESDDTVREELLAAGYTPLDDLDMDFDSGIAAFGTSDGFTLYGDGNGAVFSFPSSSIIDDDDEENCDIREINPHDSSWETSRNIHFQGNHHSDQVNGTVNDDVVESNDWVTFGNNSNNQSFGSNYSTIADQALSTLERDYFNTVNRSSFKPNSAEKQSSSTSDQSNSNIDEKINTLSVSESSQTPQQIEENKDDVLEKPSTGTTQIPSKEIKTIPAIDTDTVKRVMNNISFKSQEAFEVWSKQQSQKRQNSASETKHIMTSLQTLSLKSLPPSSENLHEGNAATLQNENKKKKKTSTKEKPSSAVHNIIPSTPLFTFHRTSSKAIKSTSHLTRSATISEALSRLVQQNILPRHSDGEFPSTLTIHIIGADRVECATKETIQTAISPLVRWISSSLLLKHIEKLHLKLLGPNVPSHANQTWSRTHPLQIYPGSDFYAPSTFKEATVTCETCLYHDYLNELTSDPISNEKREEIESLGLAIAFNAGIYGYKEWEPTIECMKDFKDGRIAFVVTSYTIEEAEDDAEEICTVLGLSDDEHFDYTQEKTCLWGVEANPFASKSVRETATAIGGRQYFENQAWQCWLLGDSTTRKCSNIDV